MTQRGIRFSHVLNRNAKVSNHRELAYAGPVGCAILRRSYKSKCGDSTFIKHADAESHFERSLRVV